MDTINETHDPGLKSWVDAADRHPDFPLQNLPFAVFRRRGSDEEWRGGVAIGESILDLRKLVAAEVPAGTAGEALLAAAKPRLNEFMGMGRAAGSALRQWLSRGLRSGAPRQDVWRPCLLPQADAEYRLPATVGDYTDFYTSIHHATRVGRLFRPDNPLLPNYRWVPIGYHGRTSSLGVSGQTFRRPRGQIRAGTADPVLAPSRRLDFELEMGVFIGAGNVLGDSIALDRADDHVFGLCLLNDWSARDIQAWEYQPLGPFLAKNFATTLSPWIVTAEALTPFRLPWTRDPGEPEPLPYLASEANRRRGALDVHLEVFIQTERMRAEGRNAQRLSSTNFRHAYWTIAQMVSHHTVNGCNLVPGDLLGTGTQSGPEEEDAGSLLELTQGGTRPVALDDGESRTFLEDGDTIIFKGWCDREGAARIGFGEVWGTVLPAR